ncbi:MAG: hypothetical protein Q4P25_03625, partial [Tissierellia bacterium]|nr:hypothetical protein [Tissierellia bacterium]
NMKLSIIYIKNLERPWLLKRKGGKYSQHAHMLKKEDALDVRGIIDRWEYPYNKDLRPAVKRLLTEEEYKTLRKKSRYRNIQKGIRK